jgi:hypothetical protein
MSDCMANARRPRQALVKGKYHEQIPSQKRVADRSREIFRRPRVSDDMIWLSAAMVALAAAEARAYHATGDVFPRSTRCVLLILRSTLSWDARVSAAVRHSDLRSGHARGCAQQMSPKQWPTRMRAARSAGRGLNQDRFRQFCRQIFHECANRREKAAPVGNESCESRIAGKPGWQDRAQQSRSDVVATDIAG